MAKNWYDIRRPNELLNPYSMEAFRDKAERDAIAATYAAAYGSRQRGQAADSPVYIENGGYPYKGTYTEYTPAETMCSCGIIRSFFQIFRRGPCRKCGRG